MDITWLMKHCVFEVNFFNVSVCHQLTELPFSSNCLPLLSKPVTKQAFEQRKIRKKLDFYP